MRTLILNYNNLVKDGENNKFIYRFPNSVQFKDSYIAFAKCSIYYSWFNISSNLVNNYFSYNWVAAGVTTSYTINIPDGLYEVATLNQLLQFTFITNGHYLVDLCRKSDNRIESICRKNKTSRISKTNRKGVWK